MEVNAWELDGREVVNVYGRLFFGVGGMEMGRLRRV